MVPFLLLPFPFHPSTLLAPPPFPSLNSPPIPVWHRVLVGSAVFSSGVWVKPTFVDSLSRMLPKLRIKWWIRPFVTSRLAIGHFLSAVLWNQPSISNGFWDIHWRIWRYFLYTTLNELCAARMCMSMKKFRKSVNIGRRHRQKFICGLLFGRLSMSLSVGNYSRLCLSTVSREKPMLGLERWISDLLYQSGMCRNGHMALTLDENVDTVESLLLSQADKPQGHRTVGEISREAGYPLIISFVDYSHWHKDRRLKCCKKRRARQLTDRVIFGMQFSDDNVITSKPTWKLKHSNFIVEYFEYLCQMYSQSIYIILNYTKTGAFLET